LSVQDRHPYAQAFENGLARRLEIEIEPDSEKPRESATCTRMNVVLISHKQDPVILSLEDENGLYEELAKIVIKDSL
jgi:hypothetical protein